MLVGQPETGTKVFFHLVRKSATSSDILLSLYSIGGHSIIAGGCGTNNDDNGSTMSVITRCKRKALMGRTHTVLPLGGGGQPQNLPTDTHVPTNCPTNQPNDYYIAKEHP